MLRHVPNVLTASRGFAGGLVVWVLLGPLPDRLGFWLFVLAVFTDLWDGWLARKLGATSTTGQWLDPLSDKVLTITCWAALWSVGWAPGWLAGAIVLRDLLVAAGFVTAWRRGWRFAPNLAGRLMITFEAVSLAVLLFHGPWLGVSWGAVGTAIGAITLALSLVSAAEYVASGPVRREAPPA